jgi:hypothetical protein
MRMVMATARITAGTTIQPKLTEERGGIGTWEYGNRLADGLDLGGPSIISPYLLRRGIVAEGLPP